MTIEYPKALASSSIPPAEGQAKPPTLKEILVKFPPKEEMIKAEDGITNISMMVSRTGEAGTILYAVPSREWASVRKHLFKEPS